MKTTLLNSAQWTEITQAAMKYHRTGKALYDKAKKSASVTQEELDALEYSLNDLLAIARRMPYPVKIPREVLCEGRSIDILSRKEEDS